jgi:hypothetical protein
MKPNTLLRFALIVFAVSYAASLHAASVIQFSAASFPVVENAQPKRSTTKCRHDGMGIRSSTRPFAVVKKTKTKHNEKTKSMKIIKNLEFATLAALAVTLLFQTSITQAADNLPTFTKITIGPVVTDMEGSAGFAWLDADNDNFLDLYVSNLSANRVLDSFYQNKGDGTFVKVTNAVTTKLSSSFVGVVGDYDNDGDEDLFVAHGSGLGTGLGNDLYRNEGGGQFTRLTSAQAGPLVGDLNDSLDAAWADYDRDGFIDLFVANGSGQNDALYRNNGDGTFTKKTANEVGVVVADRKHTGPCNWVDYDNDGYPDLWVGIGIYDSGTLVERISSIRTTALAPSPASARAAWRFRLRVP